MNNLRVAHKILLAAVLSLFFSGFAFSAPSISPQANINPTGQVFALDRDGETVDTWWVYIGTVSGGSSRDVHDSGAISGALSSYSPGALPAGTLYFTLWYQQSGSNWQREVIEITVDEPGQTLPTDASNGNLVYYNGSSWVAAAPATILDPVDLAQPSLGLHCVIALIGAYPSRSAIDPLLGEIMFVGFNFAPRGWASCDGQLLPIASNSALFSLLGTEFGGDGRTTFGLPDLKGRVPVHMGTATGYTTNRRIGDKFGRELHTFTQ